MKKNKSISTLLLVIGLTIGVLALSTARFQAPAFISEAKVEAYDKAEKSDQSDQDQKAEIKAIEAVPSTPQTALVHHFFLLETLPEATEESSDKPADDHVSSGNKVLKVLFRLIISPNAP